MFSDLNNKIIVITGGNGFLGSQFASAFLDKNSKVIVLDIVKKKLNHKNLYFYKCDITNENIVKKI